MRRFAFPIVAVLLIGWPALAPAAPRADGTREVFVGGALPPVQTIEIRPFQLCSVTLPAGELLLSKHLGAPDDFEAPDSAFGSGAQVAVVFVKSLTDKPGAWGFLDLTTNGEHGLYRVKIVLKKDAPTPCDLAFVARSTPAPTPTARATAAAARAGSRAPAAPAVALPTRTPAPAQLLNRAEDYRRVAAMLAALATPTPTPSPSPTATPAPVVPPAAALAATASPGADLPCSVRVDSAYAPPKGAAPFRPEETFNDGTFTCLRIPAGVPRPALFGLVGHDQVVRLDWTFDVARRLFIVQGIPPKIQLVDANQTVIVSHR